MLVVARVSDRKLRLTDPTHTTKNETPLLLRSVAWLQYLFHLFDLRPASNEECGINVGGMTKMGANWFSKAEVFFLLDNYQESLAQVLQ